MEVIYRKTADLIPYENNPRKIDGAVEAVANSIREFGFKVPIITDAEGVIIAGHTRLAAAEMLGLEEVPTLVADDLTDEQARAYRLADNKTAEASKWDISKLVEELDGIGMDMTQFGFFSEEEKEHKQDLDTGKELSLDDFMDESFQCTCPECGFRFNE